MTATMEQALDHLGIPADARVLVAAIVDVLAELPAPGVRALPTQELTAGEAETLRHGGLDLTSRDYGAADPFLRTRVKYAALLAEGWTVAEVAARRGTSVQWVRKQLRDRALLGVKHGDEWRLPRFQFCEDERPLPGIQRVLPHLDPAKSLVAIYNWFTTPDPDLSADGPALSPRQWLAEGRDPAVIARQAADV